MPPNDATVLSISNLCIATLAMMIKKDDNSFGSSVPSEIAFCVAVMSRPLRDFSHDQLMKLAKDVMDEVALRLAEAPRENNTEPVEPSPRTPQGVIDAFARGQLTFSLDPDRAISSGEAELFEAEGGAATSTGQSTGGCPGTPEVPRKKAKQGGHGTLDD